MRRGIGIGLIASLLVAILVGGKALRDRQDAAALLHKAEGVLAHTRESPLDGPSALEAARAIAWVQAARERHASERAEGLLAWARALESLHKDRAPRALEELHTAVARLGERPELFLLRARALLREGRLPEARGALERCGRLRDGARGQLLEADLALSEGDARAALAVLERVRRTLPLHASVENRRGVALEALGRKEEALEAYARASAHDASFAHAFVNQGRLLRESQRHREAEQAFSLAVQAAPSDAEAWLGRGLSRIAQGDLTGGRLDLERAREVGVERPEPLVALADLDVQAKQLARAIDRYRAALLLDPKSAVAWLKLGNALMRSSQHEDARQAYERAIAHEPALAAAHNGLGAARMALGDSTGAATALEAAARLDQHDPNPLKNLALLREQQGDQRGARAARDEALARLR